MRQDKLTTKFTEALSDAQSLALGNDNAYIEPVHLLAAMMRQEDGPRALLERAGVNVPGLSAAAENAIKTTSTEYHRCVGGMTSLRDMLTRMYVENDKTTQ